MSRKTVLSPQPRLNQSEKNQSLVKFIFALVGSFVIAGIIVACFGYNPFTMFVSLFKGAWVGKLNFGTTIEKMTTMLMLGTAFNLCTRVKYFNLGLEGSLYLGALTYAVVGYQFPNLPGVIYIPLCMICSMLIGAIWSVIPAYLKTKWNTNEICVTLLLNYVATYFCTYAIYYVWSAKTSIPQTPELCKQVTLHQFLTPSRANVGFFIAIAIFLGVVFVLYRTSVGYKVKAVGQNDAFAEYIGINKMKTTLIAALVGGAIAGLAGGIEVGGLYGRFVDEFAVGATFNGLLASRLVNNNLLLLPLSAFGLASLNAGAYGVERSLGINRAFVDCFTAIIIMMVVMEDMYGFLRGGISRVKRRISGKHTQAKEE